MADQVVEKTRCVRQLRFEVSFTEVPDWASDNFHVVLPIEVFNALIRNLSEVDFLVILDVENCGDSLIL